MLAVLELNDRRKFACGNLEEAKQAWRDNFSTDLRARIVVYPLAEDIDTVAERVGVRIQLGKGRATGSYLGTLFQF